MSKGDKNRSASRKFKDNFDKIDWSGKPERQWKAQPVENKSPYVIPDIEAYQVVGPEYGKVISSRSKHRQYLRQHGLIEVGDQKPKWMKNRH